MRRRSWSATAFHRAVNRTALVGPAACRKIRAADIVVVISPDFGDNISSPSIIPTAKTHYGDLHEHHGVQRKSAGGKSNTHWLVKEFRPADAAMPQTENFFLAHKTVHPARRVSPAGSRRPATAN